MNRIYVWDFPTRLFHILLISSFIFQYVTVEILDNAIQWHFYGGYFTLGLIVFRIVWGFVGHAYSRFSLFISTPKQVFHYATGKDQQQYLTHNPMGAWSVIVILSLFLTQALSGLFISDDIFHDAPYHSAVSSSTADIASWLHHNVINLIWGMVIVHIAAVLIYQNKGEKLIQAMVHGYKSSENTQVDKPAWLWLRFLILILVLAVSIYLLVEVFAPSQDLYDY